MKIIEDLAFVLSGGTYKVLVQIPALIFCELLGVYPKKIYAISGGGPNAVGFVLKKAKKLPVIWDQVAPKKLFDIDWREILFHWKPLFEAEALFSSGFVDCILDRETDYEMLIRSEVELSIGVVDLMAEFPNQVRFISTKDPFITVSELRNALLSMIRIPVFFKPLRGGNSQLVDLGLINNLPVQEAVDDKRISKIVVLSALPVSLSSITAVETWPEVSARHDDIAHVHELNRHITLVSRFNEDVEALSYINDHPQIQRACLEDEGLKSSFDQLYSSRKRKIDFCVVASARALRIFEKTNDHNYGYPSLEARYELLGAGYEAVRLVLIPFLVKHGIVMERKAQLAWEEVKKYLTR